MITICDEDDQQSLTDELIAALIGYKHTPASAWLTYGELEHDKGDIQEVMGSIVRYVDMFTAERWISSSQ